MASSSHGRYSFSVFNFDSKTGDLSRNGHRLRITEQARQVLTALLDKAGSIVSREELRQQLWPGGEFLDWDHSINKVVAQLRSALRDDARETRFIETIPKRGYRFIAPTRFEPASAEQSPQQEQEALAAPIDAGASPAAGAKAEMRRAESVEVSLGESTITNEQSTVMLPSLGTVTEAQRHRPSVGRVVAIAAAVMLLGVATALIVLHFAKPQSPSYVSVGIPPFEASGQNSDALAESFRIDLTSAVAELPKIQVRAAHSLTAPLRDGDSIRTTAESLQLDLLLFGKLTVSGDQCVFNLEVVRGQDAVHLASFRYSGSVQEAGNIRERIQRDLFEQLRLAERGGTWRTQSATPNPTAYKNYLQARLDLSGWADAPVQKALEGFQKAIDEDPNFANAYAGLASAYVILAEHGAAPRESSYRKAQEAAAKAVQLAPSTAEAHAILGQVALRQDWNFELAERELRRAVELDPSRAIYHLWLSALLCFESRFDESLHEIDLARASDPLWGPIYWTEVATAAMGGHYPRALQAADKATSLMPNWPSTYDQRGWLHWFMGRYADAIADWRHMALIENDSVRMQLEDEGVEAFRRGGVSAYAQVRLKAIRSGHPYRHAVDFLPAEWYTIAGDYDNAMAEVENMVARHDPEALQLAVIPTLRPLHNHPRFIAALMRVGLNPPKPRTPSQITNSSSIRSDAELRDSPLR